MREGEVTSEEQAGHYKGIVHLLYWFFSCSSRFAVFSLRDCNFDAEKHPQAIR